MRYAIKSIFRSIRFFFQRMFRGFDDSETWNLDYTISKMILPKLKRFKKVSITVPVGLTEDEWNDHLDKMIFAFERSSSKSRYETTTGWEKHQEGLDLFAKYFSSLWW